MTTTSLIPVEERYPNLCSPWRIRNNDIKNRAVFAPACPTWVDNPGSAAFTEQAVAFYEERAATGIGMITIGGSLINRTASLPLLLPGLWTDEQVEGLTRVAEAVHRHGCILNVQLLHPGQRGLHVGRTDPASDFDQDWFTVSPSQVPTGEYPGAPVSKALREEEIETILDDYAVAARHAIEAGLDGVEFHMGHGFLPWQFLSPMYNHRTDQWGGTYENRLRFPIEAMRRIRAAIGDEKFMGYRINSTSFWPGDLDITDVVQIVQDFEAAVDLDYVSLTAGVQHQFIHTPMEYQGGWEAVYTRDVKRVTEKPVLLVGRVTDPQTAERLLADGSADAILLARQMFADGEWFTKVREGREDDIRKCVAANHCWRSAFSGQRVQCVYNPTVGREREWGATSLTVAPGRKRVLVIGAGPGGLEYARVAAARGHDVVVYESEPEVGGHSRVYGLLPHRTQYGEIGLWLEQQARKNGANIHTASPVDESNIDEILGLERPDHVVVATGARFRRDGFQGMTAAPLPGWETGNCVAWDEVATGKVTPTGSVLVVDEVQNVAAPLVALKLKQAGCDVQIITRWPMIAMENALDVYLPWMLGYMYDAEIPMRLNEFIKEIDGRTVEVFNVYTPGRSEKLEIDCIVMATGRQSRDELYHLLNDRGVSVETIGDATSPRGTWEATFEGHRAARKL